jgi:hypothetical protein
MASAFLPTIMLLTSLATWLLPGLPPWEAPDDQHDQRRAAPGFTVPGPPAGRSSS